VCHSDFPDGNGLVISGTPDLTIFGQKCIEDDCVVLRFTVSPHGVGISFVDRVAGSPGFPVEIENFGPDGRF
jgi:hypothetical protein